MVRRLAIPLVWALFSPVLLAAIANRTAHGTVLRAPFAALSGDAVNIPNPHTGNEISHPHEFWRLMRPHFDPFRGVHADGQRLRRRAIRVPTLAWFWDRDDDGWGSREWASGPYGGGGGAGAPTVTNCLDCDDFAGSVFVSLANMVPDCNGNHVADDGILTTVCVGDTRTGPLIHGPDGTLVVNLVFADKHGTLWIPLEWAMKDGQGKLVLDFGYGGCARM